MPLSSETARRNILARYASGRPVGAPGTLARISCSKAVSDALQAYSKASRIAPSAVTTQALTAYLTERGFPPRT